MGQQFNSHLRLPSSPAIHSSEWHSPFVLSRASCRPRFLPGFRTQWLLVAVTSNTNQPSSAAQITRESSRNRSDSLKENTEISFRFNVDCLRFYKRRVKNHVNLSDRNAEQSNEAGRESWRSVTIETKRERWSEKAREGGRWEALQMARPRGTLHFLNWQ